MYTLSSYIMTYQSISINHDDVNHHIHTIRTQGSKKLQCIVLFATGSLFYITLDWLRLRLFSNNSASSKLKTSTVKDNGHEYIFHTPATEGFSTEVPIPTGVNLGSWLSLEDWFYVGPNGAVEVASPDDARAASCLPPLHLDASTGPRWNSETDLLEGLGESKVVFLLILDCIMI